MGGLEAERDRRSIASRERLAGLEAERDRREADRGALRLRDFVSRGGWGVVEQTTALVGGWCMDAVCDHLEACWRREIRKLLINVPPGYMKSLLTSVMWPAWAWAHDPSARWLFASYGADLALRDAVKCRRVVESEWYRARWGDRVRLADDQNAKSYYETTAGGFRRSTGLSGSTGQRASFLVVDDPHDLQEAYSKPAREAVLEWWSGVMAQRVDDPRTAVRVVVMQRCHESDLSGYLLREEGDWEHLCLPAEWESRHPTPARTSLRGGWTDPRRTEGELLWPERFDRPAIDSAKRSLGSRKAPGQLQQRPSPEGGTYFDRAWVRRWPRDGQFPVRVDEWLQSWDLAFKGHEDADYVAGGLLARAGADVFLVDVVRAQLTFPQTLQVMRDKAACPRWGQAGAKLVEDKANGPAVLATLQREIPGLIAVNPEGGKVSRANSVSPYVEAGNFWLPEGQHWVGDYLEELAAFPGGTHDDQVDMTTQALLRLYTRPASTTRTATVNPLEASQRHARPGWGAYAGGVGAWRSAR